MYVQRMSDSPDVSRLAEQAGVSEAQVRQILDAHAAAPGDDRPISSRRSGWAVDGALWAATLLIVSSVLLFLAPSGAFDASPEGKGSALATLLVGVLALGGLVVFGRRTGRPLAVQLAAGALCGLSALGVWLGMWLLGVWPDGHEIYGPDFYAPGVSDEEQARAGLLVCVAPLLAGLFCATRLRSALAFGVAVLAAHAFVACAFASAGAADWDWTWNEGMALVLTGAYAAAMLTFALVLERRAEPFAGWVHPYVAVACFALPGLVFEVAGEAFAAAFAAGMLLVAAGAVLFVMLRRGCYLIAAAAGALTLQFWLMHVTGMGPAAGMLLMVLIGAAVIAVAVGATVRRDRLRALLPARLARHLR